jgi:UDP-glucose 4-epimerase
MSSFKGQRVLITGGLGFIGSHLARRLLHEGAHVTIVDSLIPQYGGNMFNVSDFADRVQVNISDVRDQHGLRHLIRDKDILFNLAGQTGHLDSMTDPETDLEINCRAQLAILETCRMFNPTIKVVFASTRQVYGRPQSLPVNEKHIVRPVDVNGINKAAGEAYHILYNDVYGIRACALRLTNTYGPHMRVVDARQTFLGIWVKHLVQGEPFEVWEGGQVRDLTYVDDAVEAFMIAARHEAADGRIFNLGGLEAITLHDLAEKLVKVNGSGSFDTRSFPVDRKRIDIGDYYADYTAIREAIGWQPKVPLEEGLLRTLEFYRKYLDRYV